MATPWPEMTPSDVRAALLAGEEIALLDVREEDPYARSHPLWAANLPLSRIEIDAPRRLPRRDVPIVVYDDGEGLAESAARRLFELGWTQVRLLAAGLGGWRAAELELFRDVNVPSKAFGELVEAERHTPQIAADDLKSLLDAGGDVVVLDARRFDEYRTMAIPGSISVPGAELVLRARALAPKPATRIVVNCAGRTRSLIGAQSLVNAGVPNPVAALRNGTIGWTLAGHALAHGQSRRAEDAVDTPAATSAGRVAKAAGVRRVAVDALDSLADPRRTLYRLDVRSEAEFRAGHLPGFVHAPGGQLVQETDHWAPVRGARLLLAGGDDGVRAEMTASWLAQMGWEVWLVDGIGAAHRREVGLTDPPRPPSVAGLEPRDLQAALAAGDTLVLDVGPSAAYVQRHVPGAWWVLRSQIDAALPALSPHRRLVLACPDGQLAAWAARDVPGATHVLSGGTAAWESAGYPIEGGTERLASPRIDRYRRPYEGTDNPHEAMQAYLDWEFGLVAQLGRDGTHRFRVLQADEIAAAGRDAE